MDAEEAPEEEGPARRARGGVPSKDVAGRRGVRRRGEAGRGVLLERLDAAATRRPEEGRGGVGACSSSAWTRRRRGSWRRVGAGRAPRARGRRGGSGVEGAPGGAAAWRRRAPGRANGELGKKEFGRAVYTAEGLWSRFMA